MGSVPQLGNWDPSNAVCLHESYADRFWSLITSFPRRYRSTRPTTPCGLQRCTCRQTPRSSTSSSAKSLTAMFVFFPVLFAHARRSTDIMDGERTGCVGVGSQSAGHNVGIGNTVNRDKLAVITYRKRFLLVHIPFPCPFSWFYFYF